MKGLGLQNFGVQELDAKEMREIDGGQLPKWVKGGAWGYLASQVIEHWAEIKDGFSKGYNAQI